MYRASNTTPSELPVSSKPYDDQCSYSDNVSHGTFSSSLTSLETSDDENSATQSQQAKRREHGSVTSCKSMISDGIRTYVDDPCRFLLEYLHSRQDDGELDATELEWHESTTFCMHDELGSTPTTSCVICYLGSYRPMVAFPISNTRTVCAEEAEFKTIDSESRPLSPISLHPEAPLKRLVQCAYTEPLDTQSSASSVPWNSPGLYCDEASISSGTSCDIDDFAFKLGSISSPGPTPINIRLHPSTSTGDDKPGVIPEHNLKPDDFDPTIILPQSCRSYTYFENPHSMHFNNSNESADLCDAEGFVDSNTVWAV